MAAYETMSFHLETDRLILRPWAESDAGDPAGGGVGAAARQAVRTPERGRVRAWPPAPAGALPARGGSPTSSKPAPRAPSFGGETVMPCGVGSGCLGDIYSSSFSQVK